MPSLPAVDPTKLYILMALGSMFALAGVYLMVRPNPSDGETRIELFGLKFNASSGGLVVFLVGALFIAMAVIAPERRLDILARPGAALSDTPGGTVSRAFAPKQIGGSEEEPNDESRTANIMNAGLVILADAKRGDTDFYVMNLDTSYDNLRIIWRIVESSGSYAYNARCELSILDKYEQRLKRFSSPRPKEAASTLHPIGNEARIFLKVQADESGLCTYEIETAYEGA